MTAALARNARSLANASPNSRTQMGSPPPLGCHGLGEDRDQDQEAANIGWLVNYDASKKVNKYN